MSGAPGGTPRASDPYGIGPVRSLVAPGLAIAGLVIVAIFTLNLLNGDVPFVGGPAASGGANGDGNGGVGPQVTPAPSNVVIVEPAAFKGSIVYAKAGNIWVQTADAAKQLTSSGGDSMPTWSPDGQWVYYINTLPDQQGFWPEKGGRPTLYDMDVTRLMRVKADGSADPELLATGKFKKGRYTWAYWLREPVVSPDGKTVALVSDAPNPDQHDVTLQFFDIATGKLRNAGAPANPLVGHQDPEWRPDGGAVLFVKNGRDGALGSPVIVRYDTATKKSRTVTAPGYVSPAYSPDGKYFAAVRTSNLGTDVVIMNASNGQELLRITNDGSSFGPSWSPAGDGIVYLHLNGQTTDLKLAKLAGDGPNWTVSETKALTEVSGLDPISRPDWFIPADQLPPPTPTPQPTPAPSASGSPGTSGSPSASPAP